MPLTANAEPRAMSFITTRDGTDLFYKDWGDGEAVVFLAGWTMTSDVWQYQMIDLAERGLRCIAYDRRGHGRSGQPGRGYDYDTLADDLAAVLERLDLRRATLVGHSMAGGEIVRYLSRHGSDRVARAVLVAPTTPFLLKTDDNPGGVDGALFDFSRAAVGRDFPRYLKDITPTFLGADASAEMVAWLTGLSLQCSIKAASDCIRAFSETDFRRELASLDLPILVIHGDADVSTPLELAGRPTAALLPQGRLEIYPGALHGLMLSHMERLNGDLLAFVRG